MRQTLQKQIAAAQAGDRQAMDAIAEENQSLVWSVARRFFGRGVEAEDLFQLGSIGLVKAVRDFDLSMPVEFSTYAVPKIAGEMRRFLRDDGPIKVSRSLRERAWLVRQIQQQLEKETGESPRLSQLCQAAGLTQEEVLEALQAPRDTDSLDAPIPGENRTLLETLPDQEGEGAMVESLALREALSQLEPVPRQILLLRYMRDLTQQKVAEILGMTQVQVSRAEKRAVLALRGILTDG